MCGSLHSYRRQWTTVSVSSKEGGGEMIAQCVENQIKINLSCSILLRRKNRCFDWIYALSEDTRTQLKLSKGLKEKYASKYFRAGTDYSK
jgi:hypothetical protein